MEREEGMTTKEKILSKLKENSSALLKSGNKEDFEMPDFKLIEPIKYPDSLEKFKETAKRVSGAQVEELGEKDINDLIKRLYPEAKIIGSNLKGIEADINPD